MLLKNIYKINKLTKSYEDTKAISSLSLSIVKGELIALIGPSGAGKTTLLNTLAKIEKPDSGEIELDGSPLEDYKDSKLLAQKVGVIRQQFDLVGALSVVHNVLAGRLVEWGFFKALFSLIIPQEKELAINALNRVGLMDRMYEKTSNLSGGEQQRVALARLLVQHPEVILADEPVSSLDPVRAEDVLSILVKLVKEERQTLIASLHSVDYAKKYFSRIIGLRCGEIFFDLPSEKVTDEMLHGLYNFKEL